MQNFLFLLLIFSISSCTKLFVDENKENTPINNFEMLWKLVDENYCYFEYKNIDWDYQYSVYKEKIFDSMSDEELFNVLSEMLSELKDGHVNLYSNFNQSRYWNWYLDYPSNFDEKILDEKYLGNDYYISGGLVSKLLKNNIGYIRYSSFSSVVDDDNLNFVLSKFSDTDGIIIDIRNNGGGYIYISDLIASRFIPEQYSDSTSIRVGYLKYKTGVEHDDFSDFYKVDLIPTKKENIKYQKKVVLVTNRLVYSAANDFAMKMKALPNVILMGDTTGGGGGVPILNELYNGWSVRYSANPMFDSEKKHTEFGIAPTYFVQMDTTNREFDSILESAIDYLSNKNK
ncbi:MAG: S41 family peptidase [Bacteroidales bacterium]|nr:S41 family peptidase [Bacteroidales bacterium]